MAHTCPTCGCLCHSGGDIDDLDFGELYECTCCDGVLEDDEDEYYIRLLGGSEG